MHACCRLVVGAYNGRPVRISKVGESPSRACTAPSSSLRKITSRGFCEFQDLSRVMLACGVGIATKHSEDVPDRAPSGCWDALHEDCASK
jgi:hypothetical protein